jgi:hypothetical protein
MISLFHRDSPPIGESSLSDLQRAWAGALGMVVPVSLAGYFGLVPAWIVWMTVIVFGGGVIAATIVQRLRWSTDARRRKSSQKAAAKSANFSNNERHPDNRTVAEHSNHSVNFATQSEQEFVQESLAQFQLAGLVPTDFLLQSLDRYANDAVAGLGHLRNQGPNQHRFLQCPFPRLTALWVQAKEEQLEEYQAEEHTNQCRFFRNSIIVPDHCYDGCFGAEGEATYRELIESVLSIASDQWSSNVETIYCFEDPEDQSECIEIKLTSSASKFRIRNEKDLDLDLFACLNQQLPDRIDHRFGVLADGGSVLVLWLAGEQWDRLSEVLGTSINPMNFSSDIEPTDQT